MCNSSSKHKSPTEPFFFHQMASTGRKLHTSEGMFQIKPCPISASQPLDTAPMTPRSYAWCPSCGVPRPWYSQMCIQVPLALMSFEKPTCLLRYRTITTIATIHQKYQKSTRRVHSLLHPKKESRKMESMSHLPEGQTWLTPAASTSGRRTTAKWRVVTLGEDPKLVPWEGVTGEP